MVAVVDTKRIVLALIGGAGVIVTSAAVLTTAACGRPDDTGAGAGAPPSRLPATQTSTPTPEEDSAVARKARTFLLGQYGLGPDQQFKEIPQEGPGTGDWAARINNITYVRASHELDVFMTISDDDKDTALDAAHSIGLMVRQDSDLQRDVGSVRVGDVAGNELALQIQCSLDVNDNACQPAVWLR